MAKPGGILKYSFGSIVLQEDELEVGLFCVTFGQPDGIIAIDIIAGQGPEREYEYCGFQTEEETGSGLRKVVYQPVDPCFL